MTPKAGHSIHIGTSGWHYEHWRGPFYPTELSHAGFLKFYADLFHTVEINNSFYRLPQSQTFLKWRETVPPGFIFAVKASRYITHLKKLKDPGQPLRTLLDRVVLLEDRMGPILFQLPPRWHLNHERLVFFLNALSRDFKYAFEFRDPSWFDSRVYDALAEHGMALCIYEFAGRLSPKRVTADFLYLRLHGPEGAYRGRYDHRVLDEWADFCSSWNSQGKEIFCYFDNDEAGYAAQDALTMQEMLER
jgi:uncharacterized protein YecE (DUF72 family)